MEQGGWIAFLIGGLVGYIVSTAIDLVWIGRFVCKLERMIKQDGKERNEEKRISPAAEKTGQVD